MMKMFSRRIVLAMGLGAVAAAGLVAAGPGSDHAHAKIGEKAPAFTLKDTAGVEHTLAKLAEGKKAVVLEWFNPDCPFVKMHYTEETQTMNKLAAEFAEQGVTWIRINSGAPGKQGAGVERNVKAITDYKVNGPVLLDETGVVGKSYNAKRTPEMYVIDAEGVLRYHGAIDNAEGASGPGDTNYVRAALQSVLAGETVATPETKAYGCGVKY
jgi:peroxiredoxin